MARVAFEAQAGTNEYVKVVGASSPMHATQPDFAVVGGIGSRCWWTVVRVPESDLPRPMSAPPPYPRPTRPSTTKQGYTPRWRTPRRPSSASTRYPTIAAVRELPPRPLPTPTPCMSRRQPQRPRARVVWSSPRPDHYTGGRLQSPRRPLHEPPTAPRRILQLVHAPGVIPARCYAGHWSLL